VALVGYTNAGKTTLLNRLAHAGATTADQLFVTLDPAARLVTPPGRSRFILTDTVGFIQKLPTQLIAAFKATLEELAEADLLLHVVDASHPRVSEQMVAVNRILGELALESQATLVALNKTDRLGAGDAFLRQMEQDGGIPISALQGSGIEPLLGGIDAALRSTRLGCRVRVPYDRASVVSLLYERGRVLRRADQPDAVWLDVEIPRSLAGVVAPYCVDGNGAEGARDPVLAVASPGSSEGGDP
jgi:GTP-binding protein HflX